MDNGETGLLRSAYERVLQAGLPAYDGSEPGEWTKHLARRHVLESGTGTFADLAVAGQVDAVIGGNVQGCKQMAAELGGDDAPRDDGMMAGFEGQILEAAGCDEDG